MYTKKRKQYEKFALKNKFYSERLNAYNQS